MKLEKSTQTRQTEKTFFSKVWLDWLIGILVVKPLFSLKKNDSHCHYFFLGNCVTSNAFNCCFINWNEEKNYISSNTHLKVWNEILPYLQIKLNPSVKDVALLI